MDDKETRAWPLASKDLWPSWLISLATIIVDVDHQARVGRFVSSRERYQIRWLACARSTGDMQLRAREVELCTACC